MPLLDVFHDQPIYMEFWRVIKRVGLVIPREDESGNTVVGLLVKS